MYLSTLPFEIIMSILLLLPPRELIRFLVVSKSWCALIKSQEFIKKHFETSIETNKSYILYGHFKSNLERTFTLLNYRTFRYKSELRVPFDLPGMSTCTVVGSVNGLICLSNSIQFDHTICLTNPSINKCLILPPSTIYSDKSDHQILQISLGFGFHERTSDFKVVRIEFIEPKWLNEDDYEEPIPPPSENDFKCRAEVFSLNTKVWKNLNLSPDFPYKRLGISSGVVANECLHWKSIKRSTPKEKLVILSFHMGDETFQDIEWPISYNEREISVSSCFCDSKGKLGILAFCPNECWYGPGIRPCHIWTMEEYGDKNSWTCRAIAVSGMPIRRPLLFTRNSEVIMRDKSGKMFCYDYNYNQLLDLNIRDKKGDLSFINFTDSLVLVDHNDEPMGE